MEKKQTIEDYIKNDGGSFLVTHDQWDSTSKGPLELIGLEREENFPFIHSNYARICFDHELFKSYNDLTNKGKIEIALCHKSYHKIKKDDNNNARIIMNLEINKATDTLHDYLVVNEIGLGRISYWAAGHSNTISEDEKKLFINIVAWLTKYKK